MANRLARLCASRDGGQLVYACRVIVILALASLILAPVVEAQMPGVEEPPKPVVTQEKPGTNEHQPGFAYGVFGKYYNKFLGQESPYRPIILTVSTLVVLLQLKRFWVNDLAE